MTDLEKLEFIDDFLARQEDVLHGEEGNDCSSCRNIVSWLKYGYYTQIAPPSGFRREDCEVTVPKYIPTEGVRAGMPPPPGVEVNHRPTGTTVFVKDRRNQHYNREAAYEAVAYLLGSARIEEKL